MAQENAEPKKSRDALQQKVQDLEGDWNESENRRLQLETEVEEVRTATHRSPFGSIYPTHSCASKLEPNKRAWTSFPST